MQNDHYTLQSPSPPFANDDTSYHNSRTQRARPCPPPFSLPRPRNRCYKSYSVCPSLNSTKATHRVCSCDQRYKSTIRSVFREVEILEQKLARTLDMLRCLQPDEDEMDWEQMDTSLIDNAGM